MAKYNNKNNRARSGVKNTKTNPNPEAPQEAPLFADNSEEVIENKNQSTEAGTEETEVTPVQDEENEILKEIQDVMTEGTYNQSEEIKSAPIDEDEEKAVALSEIPLETSAKKKNKKKTLSPSAEARKAKREAKKAAYKKTTFKHKLKVMAVLTVLGMFTGSGLGVWYFNYNLKATVDYSKAGNPADYIQSIDDTLTRNFDGINLAEKKNWVSFAQGQGKTPAELSPVDNFVLAQYNATIANSYSVIGSGSVVAKTVITVDQFLYSEKKFDGEKYSFVSISPDTTGLVGDVAVCDVIGKNSSTIDSYKGKINEGNTSAEWTYNTTYTAQEHSNLNGVQVKDIQPYLICTETVTSSSEITMDENGNYVFTLHLDTIKSVLNYIKQVKRTGGLSSYPEFKSISTTFTISPDWQLIKMNIVEVYKAIKMAMTPEITGTIDFDFTINQPITMPNLPEKV